MNDYIWWRGHIDLWWGNMHRSLEYVREPYNNPTEITLWRNMGFTHEHFTGEMYDMRNPEPSWLNIQEINKMFRFEHLSWSFYKMTTGVILPEHVDAFARFKKIYAKELETKEIWRGLIMLEKWEPGHYLDMDGQGVVNWEAGDFFVWSEKCPHTAANIGKQDRYTLQLTGLRDKQ